MSCRKIEDPPIQVGTPLPYKTSVTKSIPQLLDSLPQTTFYKAAWQRADLKKYIDSLRGKSTLAPYTLFVPTDNAFRQAGYTIDKVNSMPSAQLDTLLRYLSLQGAITPDTLQLFPASITFYPLMYPDREHTGIGYYPNFYKLSVGFSAGSLYLNGWKVANANTSIRATDGAVFLIDSIVTKPNQDMLGWLTSDTSTSYYMAAIRISDSVYEAKQLNYYGPLYVDTSLLQVNGSYYQGQEYWAVFFVPDNQAFRRAGLNTIDQIRNYINNSELALDPRPFSAPKLTNMDSILVNHRIIFNQSYPMTYNTGKNYIYSLDIMKNVYAGSLDNGEWLGLPYFKNINGVPAIGRLDFPNGPAAKINKQNITTFNGVLYTVDNLLLPK